MAGLSKIPFGSYTICMKKEQTTVKLPHAVPADLKKAVQSVPKVQQLWDGITPLARNEWVCWVTSGKQEKTRGIRIAKAISKMKSGMRRPCCWVGCPHRIKRS